MFFGSDIFVVVIVVAVVVVVVVTFFDRRRTAVATDRRGAFTISRDMISSVFVVVFFLDVCVTSSVRLSFLERTSVFFIIIGIKIVDDPAADS